jgi:hypothetical protein
MGPQTPSSFTTNHEDAWWMVYTNRPTTTPFEDGLSWLFGSRLGVASSADGGTSWDYRGTIPPTLEPQSDP